jgi:phosphorylcholine metabolism protein LicD
MKNADLYLIRRKSMKKKKIFIFGCGQRGQEIYQWAHEKYAVQGFVDNDLQKQGKEFLGCLVYAPHQLRTQNYDLIFVASMYRIEITEQLKQLGIDADKIVNEKENFMHFIEDEAIDILKILDKIFRETETRYWITCGTLLGFYRSGRLISHDGDLDLCVHKNDLNGLLIRKLLNNGFKVNRVLGRLDDGFELTLSHGLIKVDIMIFYPMEKGGGYVSVYSEKIDDSYLKHNYVYRDFDVIERKYYEVNLFTPKNVDDYLSQQYGLDYMIPKKEWFFNSSPLNIEHEGKRIKIVDSLNDYILLLES